MHSLAFRRVLTSTALVTLAVLVAAGCGGDSSSSKDEGGSKSDAKSETSSEPAVGTVYQGTTSDDQEVTLTIADGGAVEAKIGWVDNCSESGDAPQEATFGPFPVKDGELDGLVETTKLAVEFDDDGASGSLKIESSEDEKRGTCDAVDTTWTAKVTSTPVQATGDGGAFEAGEELLATDFSGDDAEAGWAVANTQESFSGVEEEAMRINLRKQGVAGVRQEGDGLDTLKDVVASATVTLRAGSGASDSVALGCRQDPPWGYLFYVARDGKVGIFDNDGEELRALTTGTLETPLTNGTPVDVQIACVGDKLQLSVDDELVLDTTDDDGGVWPDGGVSLVLSGAANADATFDDVVIAEPKGA